MDTESKRIPWRPLVLIFVLGLMVVCGVRYGWGISIVGGLVVSFSMMKVDELIGSYMAGTLTVVLEKDCLALGETLRGVVTFTAKKPLKRCKLGVALELVTRVNSSSRKGGTEPHVISSVESDLSAPVDSGVIDSGRDLAKSETWKVPFELTAPSHQSAEDAKTGLGNKPATADGDKIKTVDMTRWQKDRRLRWELSVSLAAADWITVDKVKKLKFVKG